MSAGTGGAIQWRRPTIYLLVATTVVAPLDSPLISPALPSVQSALSLTDAQTGLILTSLALPGIVLSPVIGIAADRFGRTRILTGCLAVYGLAGGAIVFASTFPVVVALRLVQGAVGSSILTGLAMTLVGDFYEGPSRNTAMGVIGGATNVAVAVYPALGGTLADVDWRLPFAVYFVSTLVAVAVYVGLEEPPIDRTSMTTSYLRDAVAAVPLRRALLLYGAAFWSFALLFGVLTAVPLLLDSRFGFGTGQIGLLITAGLLVTAVVSFTNGLLAAYLSNSTLIACGFVSYGLGMVLAGVSSSGAMVAGALVVFGLGHGLSFPAVATGIAGLTGTHFRAGVMSIRTSMLMVGQALGPWLFPLVGSRIGYPSVLAGVGVLSTALGVLWLAIVGVTDGRGSIDE
jgi:MFS family permease